MAIDLDALLRSAVERNASDVHLKVGVPPMLRIDGRLERLEDYEILTGGDAYAIIDAFIDERGRINFQKNMELDTSYMLKGVARFRVNACMDDGKPRIVMRTVPLEAPTLESLHLPPILARICNLRNGLILFTGPTGSGKSTSLAAMIDRINATRTDHIVTVEDPLEFVHFNKQCIITQREVGQDTLTFANALRAALRQDPDVILIGEMRDGETFQAAISAAETGHLVFSTLHTTNVMLTIDRIMDMFPSNMHQQVRSQLALQLRACVSQRLLPSTDGKGRVPAVEVMLNNPGIAQLVRENSIKQIPNAIAGGADDGMQTFNMGLASLIKQGLIKESDGMVASDNPDELKMNLQGIYLSQGRGGILKK